MIVVARVGNYSRSRESWGCRLRRVVNLAWVVSGASCFGGDARGCGHEPTMNGWLRSKNVNTLQFTPNPVRRPLVVLALLGASALTLLGCAAPVLPAASAAANPPTVLPVQTIGATLRGDPRFSDYVDVLDFAGLGRALAEARDVTVFAPTNAAFEHSDPSWRVHAVPGTGATAMHRATAIPMSKDGRPCSSSRGCKGCILSRTSPGSCRMSVR